MTKSELTEKIANKTIWQMGPENSVLKFENKMTLWVYNLLADMLDKFYYVDKNKLLTYLMNYMIQNPLELEEVDWY